MGDDPWVSFEIEITSASGEMWRLRPEPPSKGMQGPSIVLEDLDVRDELTGPFKPYRVIVPIHSWQLVAKMPAGFKVENIGDSKNQALRLWQVTNGYLGNGYTACLVHAGSADEAIELARPLFKKDAEPLRPGAADHYPEGYWQNLSASEIETPHMTEMG